MTEFLNKSTIEINCCKVYVRNSIKNSSVTRKNDNIKARLTKKEILLQDKSVKEKVIAKRIGILNTNEEKKKSIKEIQMKRESIKRKKC